MTVENVMDQFDILAGDQTEAAQNEELIESCVQQIAARVSEGAETEQNSCLLEAAAAALAFYTYTLLSANKREITGFKAGDLSIDYGDGGVSAARDIYERAIKACKSIMTPQSFVFGRTVSLCTET